LVIGWSVQWCFIREVERICLVIRGIGREQIQGSKSSSRLQRYRQETAVVLGEFFILLLYKSRNKGSPTDKGSPKGDPILLLIESPSRDPPGLKQFCLPMACDGQVSEIYGSKSSRPKQIPELPEINLVCVIHFERTKSTKLFSNNAKHHDGLIRRCAS
jgi:hypothetical protein